MRWALICPTSRILISYDRRAASLFIITIFEADPYSLHSVRQMLIFQTLLGRCLFLAFLKVGVYLLRSSLNASLSYFARYMFIHYSPPRWMLIFYAPRGGFLLYFARWMYVPRSTNYVTHPFPLLEVDPLSFTYTTLHTHVSSVMQTVSILFGSFSTTPPEVE